MPTISMFYGILIQMYFYDDKKHSLPHIHAEYVEYHASIAIEDGGILAGSLPSSKMKLVQAWIEIHREDLMADWKLAVSGEPVFKIDPLK
ncbi:MAG: type II toxin-antitoxin system toxin DhiT [Candidatus Anammoxibacter sp.]